MFLQAILNPLIVKEIFERIPSEVMYTLYYMYVMDLLVKVILIYIMKRLFLVWHIFSRISWLIGCHQK